MFCRPKFGMKNFLLNFWACNFKKWFKDKWSIFKWRCSILNKNRNRILKRGKTIVNGKTEEEEKKEKDEKDKNKEKDENVDEYGYNGDKEEEKEEYYEEKDIKESLNLEDLKLFIKFSPSSTSYNMIYLNYGDLSKIQGDFKIEDLIEFLIFFKKKNSSILLIYTKKKLNLLRNRKKSQNKIIIIKK